MERDSLIRHGIFGGVLLATAGMAVVGAATDDERRGWVRSEDPGPEISQTRDVGAFSAIKLEGSAELFIRVGRDQKLTLRGGENMLTNLKTEVEGDNSLFIGLDRDDRRRWNWDDAQLAIEIDVPSLRSLEVEGAAEADISGFDGGNFDLIISGAGEAKLRGGCDTFSLVINGAGDVNARELKCATSRATMNGAGDASIYATDLAEVIVNGVGDVSVFGDPAKVVKRVSGFGDVDIVKSD